MPQDAFTLRYLCEELNSIFKDGKVNRITEPSNDELVLTVYTGKHTEKLMLNVNPSAPRIGIVKTEKESPLTAPNFCMLMRKHLLSATILGMEVVGFDRIIKIDFLASGEFFDSVKKTVYVELMGRYSNIILTEDGKVLGGNRGINMFDDGVRPLIVGKPYVYPPVGNKKLPNDQSLIEIFDNQQLENLGDIITDNVQGVAKSTAKEIVVKYKEKNNCEVVSGKDFFDHLNNFLFKTKSQPCILENNQEIADVLVFPYQSLDGGIKAFEKLYLAEDFYFENKEKIKRFKSKKERLNSIVNTNVKKVKKRLTAIKSKEKDALSAEENRIKGELILSNIYLLKQGDKECELDNYYDGTKIKIQLNEYLSPAKNAENFYKKYNKQKRTLIALKPQREQAESELEYFVSVLDEINLAENVLELNEIEKELISEGIIAQQKNDKNKKQEQAKFRTYFYKSFRIFVGRNNLENDKITFTAKQDDLWLHAKDYHSSHAVIESNGKQISDDVLMVGAQICAYYSKGREGGKTEIVYTQKKNVKKPSKSKPGFVTYINFKSVMVEPDKHDEFLQKDTN